MDAGDEQTLIGAAKQGDDVAYEQLLASLMEPAHRLACGLLHDTFLAEDAVQEAAVKAWRKIGNVKVGQSIRPWFLAIVANQCRDHARGHWSRLFTVPEVSGSYEAGDDLALTRHQVRSALESLSRSDRLVIVLRFYVELSWPEVAAVCGLSEAGARSRFYRALEKLRAGNLGLVAI